MLPIPTSPELPRPTHWRRLILIGTSIVLVAGGGLVYASTRPVPNPLAGLPIYTVHRSTLIDTVSAVGLIEPVATYQVSPSQPGIVASVDITPGQQVRKGQRIASESTQGADSQLASAEAGFALAKAKLAVLTTPPTAASLAANHDAVTRAALALKTARAQLMAAMAPPSPAARLAAAATMAKAEIGLAQAEENLKTLVAPPSELDRKLAATTVEKAQAAVSLARISLAQTTLPPSPAERKANAASLEKAAASLASANEALSVAKVQASNQTTQQETLLSAEGSVTQAHVQVQQDRLAVALAGDKLAALTTPPTAATLAVDEANVAKAQVALETAQTAETDEQAILNDHTQSQAQIAAAQNAVSQAQTQLAAAELGVTKAQAALAATTETTPTAVLQAAQGQEALAQQQVNLVQGELSQAQATLAEDQAIVNADQTIYNSDPSTANENTLTAAKSQEETAQGQVNTLEGNLNGTQSALLSAQSKVATLGATPDPNVVAQAQATLGQAEDAAQIAQGNVTAAQNTLTADEAAAQNTTQATAALAGAQGQVNQAQASLKVAQAQLASAEAPPQPAVVAQAENAVQSAELALTQATHQASAQAQLLTLTKAQLALAARINIAVPQAQAQVNIAQAALLAARAQVELATSPNPAAKSQARDALSEAEASLVAARAQATSSLIPAPGAVAQARDQVRLAEAAVSAAHAQVEPTLSLNTQAIGQARLTVAAAKTAFQEAQAQSQMALAPPPEADLAEARATLKQAEVQVASARQALSATVIRAPASGTVAAVYVTPGESVTLATQLATIDASGPTAMEVQASVPENSILMIHSGEPAQMSVASTPPVPLTGKVRQVGLVANSTTGIASYPVTLSYGDPPHPLLPGMTVSVSITAKVLPHVITVPSLALQVQNGHVGVLVVSASAMKGLKAPGHRTHPKHRRLATKPKHAKHTGKKGRHPATRHKAKAPYRFVPVVTGLVTPTQVQVVRGLHPGERILLALPVVTSASTAKTSKLLHGLGSAGGAKGRSRPRTGARGLHG